MVSISFSVFLQDILTAGLYWGIKRIEANKSKLSLFFLHSLLQRRGRAIERGQAARVSVIGHHFVAPSSINDLVSVASRFWPDQIGEIIGRSPQLNCLPSLHKRRAFGALALLKCSYGKNGDVKVSQPRGSGRPVGASITEALGRAENRDMSQLTCQPVVGNTKLEGTSVLEAKPSSIDLALVELPLWGTRRTGKG
jgi:hypothetical protein